jgi:hypothetical protein
VDRHDEPPIACTLGGADLEDRAAWIAALNGRALRARSLADLRLELSYGPDALADLREMVRREQECCAFLTFDLRVEGEVIRLIIEAPEAARGIADALFALFERSSARSGCRCAGGIAQRGDGSAGAEGIC